MNNDIYKQVDFNEKLKKRFPGGQFNFITFIYKGTEVEFSLPRIMIRGDKKNHQRIMSFILDYTISHKRDWIMIGTEDEKPYYETTSPEAEKVLGILLQIDGLTPSLEFEKDSVFNRRLKLSFRNEATVGIQTHQDLFVSMKNEEDVKNFNELQKDLRKEHEEVKKAILEVAQKYDKKASFSDDDKLIQFCSQNFAFVTRKIEKGWKVSYFKKFNSNHIFEVPSLVGFKNELIEMTDKFAREERYVELFK